MPEVPQPTHTLYPFQAAGAAWLASRRAAALFDEMGLGKTAQALMAARPGAPLLVVCPKLAKHNWVREAGLWRPELTTAVLDGRGSFRWPAPGELVIVNFDILPDEPGRAPPGVVVICDEAHYVKSAKSHRAKRFRLLSRGALAAVGRVYLLTGTPLLTSPPDLWAVLNSAGLAEEAFGPWPRFCRLMGCTLRWVPTKRGRIQVNDWSGRVDPEVPKLLRRVSLLRRRVDVLPELPPKRHRPMRVDCVGGLLRVACDAYLETLAAKGIDVEQAVREVVESRGGVEFEQLSRLRERLATAKIPALIELVEEYEAEREPLVVFSRHRAPVEALAGRPGWGVIHGGVSAALRDEIVGQFQRGKLAGLACTIQAGGVAITLTRASEVVFVDLDWTPALNEQAEDRLVRIGQTRGVLVTRLEADHELDWRVNAVLTRKQSMIAQSIGASARGKQ